MAETPPPTQPPPPSSPPPPTSTLANNSRYAQRWCYECDKRVAVEVLPNQPGVICFECKSSFVESISVRPSHPLDIFDDGIPPLSNEIVQFLRAIVSPEDEDDTPPLPSDGAADDNVRLRTELEGRDDNNDNDNDDEDEDEDEDEEDENRNQGSGDRDGSDDEDDEEEERFRRRIRRRMLRLRLRDHGLSAGRDERILDWAELLLQLEDQSVTFGLQRLESDDSYVGNPGDYLDAAGYDALLQNLAEIDNGDRRGAPPAAKWAVEALQTVEVKATNTEFCAVCKYGVFNNEQEIVKQLPCGHMYHGVCIVPWLDSRNTCPVCRHELPTDDPDYEEDRKQRSMAMAATIDHGCSSSSGSGV